jgi:uncharacterized protein YjbI with pentapeptide repeats
MNTIKIKNTSGKVLYTHTCKNNTIKITLEKAVSERADLYKADLINAYLEDANLINADLRDANLRNANLRGAYLEDANLRNANLRGAYLEDADLRNANLYKANLGNNKNYYSFVAYDTSKRLVHCVKHKETWMIKAGCFWGTLKELEEKVLQSHKSKVYLHNIELLKTL